VTLADFDIFCLDICSSCPQRFFNYLAFKYFGPDRTWWKLFQKRVVRTKYDIYVFIDCESDQSLVCVNRLWIRSITGLREQIVNQINHWSVRTDCESDQSLVCVNRLWIKSITGLWKQIVNQINHWSMWTDCESDQSLVCVNRLWIRSITGLCEQIVNQINHWSVRTDCESDQSLVCVNRFTVINKRWKKLGFFSMSSF
jgi:hypothetical protein